MAGKAQNNCRRWLARQCSCLRALEVRLRYAFILRLENYGANYNRKKAKLLLVLLTTAVAGISGYKITEGCYNREERKSDLPMLYRIRRIPVNKEAPVPERPADNRLQRARGYLDSLAGDPHGEKIYDSLIKARPGLPDSLRRAESYYNYKQ